MTQQATHTLGEHLVTLLEHYGVTTVFGIPGVHTIEMYRGLKSSSIKHITPRHEQGAGFMADGYARATGGVGVCFCITGPGMSNIATPMGQAFADSIPMLVISSVNKTHTLGQGLGRLHELKDQRALIAGVSEFSHTVLSAEELPDVMAKAFAVFSSARPRPVHIEIPIDLMTHPVKTTSINRGKLSAKPGPDQSSVEHITQLLATSKQTLLMLGGGCIDAAESVNRFVDLLGAPTCLTINARGLLSPEHPLLIDGAQSFDEFRNYAESCDVCIAIGTELGETDYDLWAKGPLITHGEFVRIDIDPKQLSNNVPATVSMVSDAKLALNALYTNLKQHKMFKPQDNASDIAGKINASLKQEFSAPTKQYEQLLSAITTAHPNAIIVGDSTKPVYHGNFVHRAAAPRTWFNSATGFGTLGYAMPAAIGAKLGKPDTPVVAIAGDGGFQFTLNELIVATQEKVAIAVIVWNNHAYKEINDYMLRSDIEPVGVDVIGPDLKALAQAMRCDYVLADTIEEVSTLLAPLASSNKPLIIEYIAEVDA